MGLIECASANSVWRGYDNYKEKKVSKLEQIGDNTFRARVAGGSAAPYNVEIDTLHPRKSKCNCPHAAGKRIVCKHMIATYFAVFPDEADRIYNEALEYEKEEERRDEELYERVIEHVGKMKKGELQEALLQVLFDGPEWQYDRFVRDYLGEFI